MYLDNITRTLIIIGATKSPDSVHSQYIPWFPPCFKINLYVTLLVIETKF